MSQDDDLMCGQINLGVPYRKIDCIQFNTKSHYKVNNQTVFQLQFQCKYEGLNKADMPLIIKRKFSDFQWLATSIKSQYSNFLIVPYLETFQKGYASLFNWTLGTTKTSYNSKQQKQVDPGTKYQVRVIKRFIEILSQISLKYMYHKPGQQKNPLFIFIQNDSNYKFFRSLYDQQNTPQEGIFSGYLNAMLEYIPKFSKQKSQDMYGLEDMQEKMQKLHSKGNQLMSRLKDYRDMLRKTYDNFIKKQQHEQLRKKVSKVQNFLYRLQQNLRYAHLILSQINENIKKYIAYRQNSQKQADKYIARLVSSYLDFVERQRLQINGNIHRIGKQFIEVNTKDKERVKIQIGEIYPNYEKATN